MSVKLHASPNLPIRFPSLSLSLYIYICSHTTRHSVPISDTTHPTTRHQIILAEPELMNDAKRSKDSGTLLGHTPQTSLNSVADGLRTTLGPNTWPIIRDSVDEIITVTERQILRATKLVWDRLKVCIEPSAGVGVAVVLGEEFRRKYTRVDGGGVRNVGVVLCGGNVDILKVARLMEEAEGEPL